MTLAEFIIKVNYALRGTDDDAPTSGTDYDYWVSVGNTKKDELYRDSGQDWSESYEERSLGNIAAGTQPSFELEKDFLGPVKQVYVVLANGARVYYDIVKPQEATRWCREVYIAGRNPETLTFSNDIADADQIVGGELFLPGHWLPKNVAKAGDTIPVPDPNWLVMATAAEIAFNDLTYEDKFPDLQGKANNLYKLMTRRNRRGIHGRGRQSPYHVQRIRGFRR